MSLKLITTPRVIRPLSLTLLSLFVIGCSGGSSDPDGSVEPASVPANTDDPVSEPGNNSEAVPSTETMDADRWHAQIIIEQYSYGGPYGAVVLGNFYRYRGDDNQLEESLDRIPL